jgi:hypothetical protein
MGLVQWGGAPRLSHICPTRHQGEAMCKLPASKRQSATILISHPGSRLKVADCRGEAGNSTPAQGSDGCGSDGCGSDGCTPPRYPSQVANYARPMPSRGEPLNPAHGMQTVGRDAEGLT